MNAVAELIASAPRVVPLIEAVELNPRADRAALSDDLEVSFLPMAAVEAGSGRMDATALRQFGHVKKGYTAFREGDVLFAKITPCMENGKMAVARGLRNGIGCGSTEFHVLRPRPGVDPQYVYYFVSSARFRAEAAHHMTGAVGQKRVPGAFLAQCEIPLPDLGKQHRIVAELEKQFSRLDEAVANLKRAKANLRRYRTAVLDASVNGRIGIEVAASGSGLPAGWVWGSIRELATVGTGATPARSNEAFWGGKIPWITSSAVNEPFVDAAEQFVTAEALRQTNLTLYPPGTLLVAMYGEGKTRGKCSELRIAATTNQAVAALQVDPAVRHWLKLFLEHNYNNTRRIASGGVQPNLNLGLIRSIGLPLPPVSEQHRIVAEVDRRNSIARDIGAEIDASLARAQALRTATLTRAFFLAPEFQDSRGPDET